MRHFKRMRQALQVTLPGFLLLAPLSGCQSKTENHRHRGIPEEAVPGSFKVVVESCIPASERMAFVKSQGEKVAQQTGCELASVEALAFEQPVGDLALSYHVQFNAACTMSDQKLKDTLELWENLDGIKEVEAEAVIAHSEDFSEDAATLDDPMKKKQYYLKSIHRDEACQGVASLKLQPVIVAVVDSGVDKDHPDLVDAFLRDSSGKVIGANFVGKGGRTAADDKWDDQRGHGTHVAGLIAATARNAKGMAGVAACAPIKIMPVRVLGSNGKGSSLEIERGVEWALAHGADVINLSLGGTRFFKDARTQHRSSIYEMARSKKVMVFASAGNSSYRLGKYYEVEDKETRKTRKGFVYSYPGSYDHVITVAATNWKNELTDFSNRGYGVDIAAPGRLTLSTYPGGTYKNMSGTSMAAPIAAGSYALVLSAIRKSKTDRLSYEQIHPLITASTGGALFSKDDVLSQGVIDVNKLLLSGREKFVPVAKDEDPEQPVPTPEQPKAEDPVQPAQPPVDVCTFDWKS